MVLLDKNLLTIFVVAASLLISSASFAIDPQLMDQAWMSLMSNKNQNESYSKSRRSGPIDELTGYIQDNTEFMPNKKKPELMYKQISALPKVEQIKKLEEIIGKNDTWKNSFLKKFIQYITYFRRKPTQDLATYKYILSNKNTQLALENALVFANQARDINIRSTVLTVQGERRTLANLYIQKREQLASYLYFFINLENGDTFLEKQKFSGFQLAVDSITSNIQHSAQAAKNSQLPMILELESSTQSYLHSPLLYSYFQEIQSLASQVATTPNGGKILLFEPDQALVVSDSMNQLRIKFKAELTHLKAKLFVEDDAKTKLIQLLQFGEGFGYDYIRSEMDAFRNDSTSTIQPDASPSRVCSDLFI